MASFSIGCNCAASGNLGVTAAASVSAGAQSVSGNYTTINYSYSASRTGWTFTGTSRPNAGALVLVINGTTCVNVALPLNNGSTNGTGLVSGSGSVNVYHNGDGTKSISVTFRIDKGSDPRGANYVWNGDSSTQSMTLTTIPRASNPSLSASEATLGNSITINTNRKSTAFTHCLWWFCGSSGWKDIAGSVGDSYSWSIPKNIANYIASATEATITIICRTYNGSTQVGNDQYATFKGKVPSDIVPSISNLSVWDKNSNVSSKFGVYLKGASWLGISFNCAGSYGSDIASKKVEANGQTFWGNDSVSTDYLYTSGSLSVTVTVTDTRGRSASKSIDITVQDYGTPWVNSFKGIRCNSDGSANDGGQYIKLQFDAGVYSVSNKNTAQYQLGYRITDSGNYSWKILDISSLSYSNTTGVISGLTFSAEHSYDLILWVGDKLGNEARRSDVLATEFRLMDWYKDGTGMAIGKVAESPKLFDVGMNSNFRKNLQLDGILNPNIISPSIQNTGGGNTANYMHIATIKVNATYVNVPFVIEYLQRGSGGATRLHIMFNASNNVDPALGLFVYEGRCRGAYLVKASTSTWNLYITKSEAWEDIGITDIRQYSPYAITITKVQNNNISSLPSGGTWAVEMSPFMVKDVNQSDNTTFAYSKIGMELNNITWLACWNGYELRAINKNVFVPISGGTMTGLLKGSRYKEPFVEGNNVLRLARIAGSKNYIEFACDNGAWGVDIWASDASLKKNIKNTEVRYALEKIAQLHHVGFDWKENDGHVPLGYVADDVEKVLPCLVFHVTQYDENNKPNGFIRQIDHTTLIPLITMGMQELIEEKDLLWQFDDESANCIIKLRQEVDDLKDEVKELKAMVSSLTEQLQKGE